MSGALGRVAHKLTMGALYGVFPSPSSVPCLGIISKAVSTPVIHSHSSHIDSAVALCQQMWQCHLYPVPVMPWEIQKAPRPRNVYLSLPLPGILLLPLFFSVWQIPNPSPRSRSHVHSYGKSSLHPSFPQSWEELKCLGCRETDPASAFSATWWLCGLAISLNGNRDDTRTSLRRRLRAVMR